MTRDKWKMKQNGHKKHIFFLEKKKLSQTIRTEIRKNKQIKNETKKKKGKGIFRSSSRFISCQHL